MDKYRDLTWELEKQWNMKVTIIPIVISALGTITERLIPELEDLEIRGQVETVQTTANRPEYLEESWRLEGTCC